MASMMMSEPVADCVHCGERVWASYNGPVGFHKEITCHKSPNRVHAVSPEVCGFDTNGDGNCGRSLCPACSPDQYRPEDERASKAATEQIKALLAPKTSEQAKQRRLERDRRDAEKLRSIVRRHHETLVEGLTEDDLYPLATVAHRLDRSDVTWADVAESDRLAREAEGR